MISQNKSKNTACIEAFRELSKNTYLLMKNFTLMPCKGQSQLVAIFLLYTLFEQGPFFFIF